MKQSTPLLSVVVPVYNEAAGLAQFHAALMGVLFSRKALPNPSCMRTEAQERLFLGEDTNGGGSD